MKKSNKGRIVEQKDGDFRPEYRSFGVWWGFSYDNVVGGCDLGMAYKEFGSYKGAYSFLVREGYDVVTEREEKVINLRKSIEDLEKTVKEQKFLLHSLM